MIDFGEDQSRGNPYSHMAQDWRGDPVGPLFPLLCCAATKYYEVAEASEKIFLKSKASCTRSR